MNHAQDKKKFFLVEITKTNHQLSESYFIKISYVPTELWIFFYLQWCFLSKKLSLFPAKTAVRCFKCVPTTKCVACLSVKLQWMIQVTKGKYRTTLEFKSSGCAVSNNLHLWLRSQFVSLSQSYRKFIWHMP